MSEGTLPQGWVETKLHEVCELIFGQSPPSDTYNSNQNGYPFFQGKAEFGPVSPIVEKWCTKPTRLAKTGDILISVRAPVGPMNLASEVCAIGRGLAAIRPLVNRPYVQFYLKLTENELASKGTGTTFKAITKDVLKNHKIKIAPLNEQKRIVDKIELMFSDLDKGEALLKQVQKQLATYRQSVLKAAFDAKNGWINDKIGKVCKLIDGDRGLNYPKRGDYKAEGYCLFLSTKNVRTNGFKFEDTVFISKAKHEQLRGGKLERGDVVVTTRGTLGNVAHYNDDVPFEVVRVNSGMLILRITDKRLSPSFLTRYIMSYIFQNQVEKQRTGTAQPQLPSGLIKLFDISFPSSFSEQEEIINKFDETVSQIDMLETWCATELKRSATLRQSILKSAFSGKLVPQNARDEPASELLARVAANRIMNKTQITKPAKNTVRKRNTE